MTPVPSQTSEMVKEGLLVRNVPVMMDVAEGEHPGVLSDKEIDQMLAQFETRKAFGKLPRYLYIHGGDPIGFIVGAKRHGPWVYCDILITDPAYQAKYNQGNLPSMSAEVYTFANGHPPLLWAVASTGGQMGQFDIEKPDAMPDELRDELSKMVTSAGSMAKFSADGKFHRCAQPKEQKMSDSPETLAKLERVEKLALENAKRAETAEKAAFESKKAAFLSKLTAEKRLVKESDKLELELADTPEKFEAAEKRMAALPVVPERKSFITAPPAKPATDGTESPADEAKKYLAAKKAAGMTRYAASKQLRDEKPEVYKEWLNEINGRDVFQNGRPAPVRN